jgi:formylglycine-generating enzyme required for sulfatase activity
MMMVGETLTIGFVFKLAVMLTVAVVPGGAQVESVPSSLPAGSARITPDDQSKIDDCLKSSDFDGARNVLIAIVARGMSSSEASQLVATFEKIDAAALSKATVEQWAEVIRADVDPLLVTSKEVVEKLRLSGMPWLIRERRTGIVMAFVPSGCFMRGAPDDEKASRYDQRPQAFVIVSRGFYISQCEVSQGQWLRVMDKNPSHCRGSELPVEQVTAEDVDAFLARTSLRLPRECEWEYACGDRDVQKGGRGAAIDRMTWWAGNAGGTPHEVGSKAANQFGLHDMFGNVEEWCADSWYEYPKDGKAVVDPVYVGANSPRVVRGGSILDGSTGKFRPWVRGRVQPFSCGLAIGFRVARFP